MIDPATSCTTMAGLGPLHFVDLDPMHLIPPTTDHLVYGYDPMLPEELRLALRSTLARKKRPSVRIVTKLVKGFYELPGNGTGGWLHVVLDDENVDDKYVQYCLDVAAKKHDPYCALLCKILLRMSPNCRIQVGPSYYVRHRRSTTNSPRTP